MSGNILTEAADWFKSKRTSIASWYEDDGGRYAFRVRIDGQDFIVCATQYLYQGRATFMADKVVQRAIDTDALLLEFVADGGYQYVFDPEAVQQYGEPSDPSESKRAAQGEDWLEITAQMGVSLQDWADGNATPKRHPDPSDPIDRKPERKADGAGETPDRPWDITAWGDGDA